MEYRFRARNVNGEIFCGNKKAASERDVALWMKELSLTPLRIDRRERVNVRRAVRNCKYSFCPQFFGVSSSEKVNFFRNLALLTSAGVSLAAAVDIIRRQDVHKGMEHTLEHLSNKLDSGSAFSEAICGLPRVFDQLCVAYVRSGEESGRLGENMSALAALLDGRERLRKKIISAAIYPSVVVVMALAVIVVMTAVVIPQFEIAFSSLNVPMPPVTAFIFTVGRMAGEWRYLFLLTAASVILGVAAARRFGPVKNRLDHFLLKLPILGNIMAQALLARSFSTLASLLDAGVPLTRALQLAGEAASNAQVSASFMRIKNGVTAGIPINAVMKRCPVFPAIASSMIEIGEEAGKTGAMFRALAENYEFELDEKTKRLTSLLEPLMVLFVGLVVAFMACAIFLPIVSVIENFI